MWATQFKLVAAVLLAVGVLAGGAGLLLYSAHGDDRGAGPTGSAKKVPPPERPEPRADAGKGEGRARALVQARAEVRDMEQEFLKWERNCTEELIKARSRVMACEDHLRSLEREQALHRERERDEAKPVEMRVHLLQATVHDLEKNLREGKADKQTTRQLDRARAQLRELEDRTRNNERKRNAQLAEARQELVAAEEGLRLIERRQAFERTRWHGRLEAADERVRLLKGGEPLGRGAMERRQRELERKLDLLLRELTELRREMRRRPR
jgi:hypothetical protein